MFNKLEVISMMRERIIAFSFCTFLECAICIFFLNDLSTNNIGELTDHK